MTGPLTTFVAHGNEDSGGPGARDKKPDIRIAPPTYAADPVPSIPTPSRLRPNPSRSARAAVRPALTSTNGC